MRGLEQPDLVGGNSKSSVVGSSNSDLTQEGWNWVIFKVSSNPSHSVILRLLLESCQNIKANFSSWRNRGNQGRVLHLTVLHENKQINELDNNYDHIELPADQLYTYIA